MDFLETIESMREDTTVASAFRGEGKRVRGRRGSLSREAVKEGLKIIEGAVHGSRRALLHFEEAMTTDDFPLVFGDVIDRTLLGGYRAWEPTYQSYMRVREVRDFRDVKAHYVDGAEGVLDNVKEREEYPEAALTEGIYTLAVTKFGRRLGFSWEMIINDDLGGFLESTERLGRAARRTEEYQATLLITDANGPDATFFSAGNGNKVTGDPVLGIAGLTQALTQLAGMVDTDGEPILLDVVHLVIPPALEVVANNLLNAVQIEMTDQGGTAGQKLIARNWLAGRLQVHVNPYLATIPSANKNTQWYLFADPNGGGRPAVTMAFLRGHREPELFVKDPNARRVGGGDVDPLDGDFDTDAIDYKVRHVLGGALMDPKAAVASQGDAA